MEAQVINKLLKAGDASQASDNLMQILLDKDKRESLFRQFLDVEKDLSYDWFQQYFEDDLADRRNQKQDFTPMNVGSLVSQLVNEDTPAPAKTNLDVGAGTGGLTISKWNTDQHNTDFFSYYPHNFWYEAEELKLADKPSRALPFLLFNFLIRGMNGIVLSGDSLNRTISQVFFIQNSKDSAISFSDLNVLPRTKEVEDYFDIRKWIDEPINHIEEPATPRGISKKLLDAIGVIVNNK